MSEPTQEMLDAWAKIPKVTEYMGCNECKTLDQPVLDKFSLGEWP